MAIAFSTLSLVSSTSLLNQFYDKREYVAAEAVRHIFFQSLTLAYPAQVDFLSRERHDKLGFRQLGLLMSVPQALVSWSIVFFVAQIFSLIIESAGLPLLYSAVIVSGSVGVVLLAVVVRFLTATVLDIWRRRRRQYGSAV